MNNFPIYQPISLSENSTPIAPVLPAIPIPSAPSILPNFTPPKLVLTESYKLMI
ncbi:hypothetical protein [Umezakia ovalisporum]|jgi:hypothetical protein|uniref:Uncharacterized protein n=2 Tax=Umezakia ovalisporum TaxID=75695 RepID=A0AA43GXG0_9CYAN|nr:hypothetical protein [Umezakia ovalisporum]MDH6057661.1 hypothetical protein [Umezakia ovalisporum FSS-43]MDH6063544.1 hypothetical protein [Umezakia ovalisporum FSS-62]MDH6066009.1 hypothetical protein [Umezakia ovalisporum APH033B]MDH6072469.1 hypothetical protein [Umezakia ovalisporum CobakiLakeA]MDH6075749.1 hypothetical protein [Umezakia ovalisporum CS-1034]